MSVTAGFTALGYAMRGGEVSHFGDPSDTGDNGIGAWGFPYRDFPDYPGIALPISVVARFELSPFHPCRVYNPANKRSLWVALVDKGPAARLGRPADLLLYPWLYLGFMPEDGTALLDILIYGVKPFGGK